MSELQTPPFKALVAMAAGASLLLALGAASPTQAGKLALDLRGAGAYTNNLNNAESDSARKEDFVLGLDAIADYRHQLDDTSGVVVKLGLETEKFIDTTDLDSITGMTSLGYVLQPWRGFTAPWFALFGEFRWREHRHSDIRDGSLLTFGATTGKRFTDRLSGNLRYEYRRRNPTSNRVFDLKQWSLASMVNYRATDSFTAYLEHEYLKGGLVTTAPGNPKFRLAARASAADSAFGAGFVAWRLDGHANSFRLGGKYSVTKRTALDGGVGYAHTDADNDNKWDVWRAGLSLVHRFK